MNDTFLEKIVARRKTGQDYLKIFAALIGATIILFAIMLFGGYISFLVPLLLIGLGYGLWLMITGMNREYEYIVTNGEIDIDMIVAKRKRKRVFSGKARDFEIMARVDSDEYRQAQRGKTVLKDYSAHIQAPDNWFFVTDYKSERVLVVFAPDERMLKNLKRFNPSKIKYYKVS